MMKSFKLSVALLCMGLAGCSLPFFGPKEDKKVTPVEVEEQLVDGVEAEEAVFFEKERAGVVEKEIIEQRLEELDNLDAGEDVISQEEVSLFTQIVGAVQASVFKEEEVESSLEEVLVEEEPLFGEGFLEEVNFIESEVVAEPEVVIPVIQEDLFLEMPVAEEVMVDEITADDWASFEQLEEEIRQAEEALAEQEEMVPALTPEEVKEIIEEEELVAPEIVVPVGALPSTGAASPLASLWGWVKSWF